MIITTTVIFLLLMFLAIILLSFKSSKKSYRWSKSTLLITAAVALLSICIVTFAILG